MKKVLVINIEVAFLNDVSFLDELVEYAIFRKEEPSGYNRVGDPRNPLAM